MRDPSMIIFVGGFALLLPVLLKILAALTRLVQLEYALHKDDWQRDGRPFVPGIPLSEYRILTSSTALNLSWIRWLVTTPNWAVEDPQAADLLGQYRRSALIWNVGCVAIFLTMALV